MTGVCIMGVEEETRHRARLRLQRGADRARATAGTLRASSSTSARLLVDTLDGPLPAPTPQTGEPTYAEKITPDEMRLAWDRPAVELDRLVRVGGAWTTFRDRRLKVHDVEVVADVGRAGSPRRRRRDRRHGKVPCSCSPCSRRANRRCAGPTSPTAPARPRRAPRPLTPPGHPSECFRPSEGLRPGGPQQTLGRSKHSGGRTATSSVRGVGDDVLRASAHGQ